MKKTLLVIIALACAAQAGAKVFVYNWTCKETLYKYAAGDMWQENSTGKGYLILDVSSDSASTTFIEFQTRQSNGKTLKEMWKWTNNFRVVTATLNNKTFMILSVGDSGSRIFLTGEALNGTVKHFTGSEILKENYGNDYASAGTTKWTFNINKNWSEVAEGVGFDSTETVNFVGGELAKLGYVWQ